MNHFLLTRWNLPGCLAHSSLEKVLDPRWQARRRDLLARYCAASVRAQTARDFSWLFLVDATHTRPQELEWLRSLDSRLRVVPVEDQETSGAPEARRAILESVSPGDWVLTTRLDSDDVLHPDHLRRVRVSAGGARQVVEFMDGYSYDVLRDELRASREPQNAFVTVAEPVDDLRTAWAWEHHRIGEDNEILYLDGAGWMALVHDQNTTGGLWGERVTRDVKRAVLAEFGIVRPPYLRSRLERVRWHARRARRLARRALEHGPGRVGRAARRPAG